MENIVLFWFRRDLRLEDNAGLYHALRSGHRVLPLFIFDKDILSYLNDPRDARVTFIHDAVTALHTQLAELGSSILVRHGQPAEIWEMLTREYKIAGVYTNRDYEPSAIARDNDVQDLLKEKGIPFHHFKDQVIFDGGEVLKADGTPYTVFTPYSRKWKAKLDTELRAAEKGDISFFLKSYPNEKYFSNFAQTVPLPLPSLADIGFERSDIGFPSKTVARGLIRTYDETRNFPAQRGTSRLGVHFRFGTISIREKARNARGLNGTFLNELIWRDFYAMILQHFPHVVGAPFRKKYERIPWRNDELEFKAWCEGRTGYPLVDAGMRELAETGYMHNRVRMVVASFLTKHLLIDWRWGEAWFAEKLLDFDLASNNGGWQWAAGCGTDAAPYFRVFNPESQMKKFDKELKYVRKWVPEYGTPAYPRPIVDHKEARVRCLDVYKTALNQQ
ncbi:MAG: deoxyribodipyrimidine photo-lyase [Bacteroidota bacterium]